jgi:DNA polymerase-3 subunit beta
MIVNRINLLNCLQKVIKVIPQRNAFLTLTGVALLAEDGPLSIRGTDLELGIEVRWCACQGEIKTVLPAKLFLDIISKCSGSNVEIEVQDNTAEIHCGNSHYKISAMNYEDYPTFPEIGTKPFIIPLDEFKKAIEKVVFAVSQDQTRGALTGLCLDLEKKTLSATNGFMFSEVQNLNVNGKGNFILPFKTAKELLELNGDNLEVKLGEGQVEFIAGNIRLFSRLIEGEFPSTEGLISEEYENIFYFNYEPLTEALKRINIIKPESVLFNLKEKTFYAESPEFGSIQEQIEFWYEKEGKLEKFSFNPKFLIDPLNVIKGGQVIIKANSEIHPMVLEERGVDDWKYLFMPLKIEEDK